MRQHPPAHELIAAFIGFEAPASPVAEIASTDDPSGIGSLITQFPSGFVPADR